MLGEKAIFQGGLKKNGKVCVFTVYLLYYYLISRITRSEFSVHKHVFQISHNTLCILSILA